MITFRVAQERYGWAVQMDQGMTTPFRSRELAIREAESLAGALMAHGQHAEVIIDGETRIAGVVRFEPLPHLATRMM